MTTPQNHSLLKSSLRFGLCFSILFACFFLFQQQHISVNSIALLLFMAALASSLWAVVMYFWPQKTRS